MSVRDYISDPMTCCGGDEQGADIPMVDLGVIRSHMPPGVEPLPDHFDVLGLQESLKDNPRQQAVVAFTLRASYEALRDQIVAASRQDEKNSELGRQLAFVQNKLNASFTTRTSQFEPKIMECLKADPRWDAPEILWVEMRQTMGDFFSNRDTRKYQYALVQNEYDHPAYTVYAQSVRWMMRFEAALGMCPQGDGSMDPEAIFNTFEEQRRAQGELEEKLLKLCNVDPASDLTVLDGVQAMVDLATTLSTENVRLRQELDAARGGDYIHRRKYVHHLEETLVAIGRQLGHKTLPDCAKNLPYTHQMTTYCSRLLQAVRTRMNNAKSKKGTK